MKSVSLSSGRMWCSATSQCWAGCSVQPASHTFLALSPSIPTSFLLLFTFLTQSTIYLVSQSCDYRSLTLTALVFSQEKEERREGGSPISPADTRLQGLGQRTATAGSCLRGTHSGSRRKEFGREVNHMIVIHPALLKCGRRGRKGCMCQH